MVIIFFLVDTSIVRAWAATGGPADANAGYYPCQSRLTFAAPRVLPSPFLLEPHWKQCAPPPNSQNFRKLFTGISLNIRWE